MADYIIALRKICVKAQVDRNIKTFVKLSIQTNLTRFIRIAPNLITALV